MPFSVSRASLSIPPLGLDSVEVSGNKFERNSNGVYVDGWTYGTLKVIGNVSK